MMTDQQIDALSLDDLRIECAKAYGWILYDRPVKGETRTVLKGPGKAEVYELQPGPVGWETFVRLNILPDYSHDIAAAWSLIGERWYHLTLVRSPGQTRRFHHCHFLGTEAWGTGDSPAEAICRAYLREYHTRHLTLNGT